MQSNSAPSFAGGLEGVATAADLVAHVEGGIVEGTLIAGDRLPPVRSAADQLGLAPNTVAAAYRRLAERGLVNGEGRRGTFIADRLTVERAPGPSIPTGLIDLSSGNPDPALLPDLGDALQAISTEHVSYGGPPLDAGLAAILTADLGADLPPHLGPVTAGETLAVVGGALDGIERVLAAHLRPGDRVAVEDPGYSSVVHLVKAMSFRPLAMNIDSLGPTVDGLTRALDGGAAAVVITPRAQNPTGAAVSAERAAELSEVLAQRPEVVAIEDDHAGPISGAPHRTVAGSGTHWAIIRSVAKSLGPDFRLAGLTGDRTTVARVTNRQMLGPGWVSHILQRTVAELLTAPHGAARFAEAAAVYRDRRQVVIDHLDRRGIAAGGNTGLNVWVPVPDEAQVVAGMQHHGYAVLAGARFRMASEPAVRISIGTTDIDTLRSAAEALGELLTEGPGARSA